MSLALALPAAVQPTRRERTFHLVPNVDHPTVELNLFQLVAEEEELAYRAMTAGLSGAEAERLATIAAEIDRRWLIALG